MEVAVLFAIVIGLMLIGVPIAVSLGLSSIMFLLVLSDTSLAAVAQTFFEAMAGHYTLLAIPFFILASSFMSTGGVARRIIRFSIAVVGHFPGGLAIAGVFACMMFAALSGSSPATVVAIGSIVIAGDAPGRLYQGFRRWGDCQRGHSGNPDPAVHRYGGLCLGHRCFGRADVSCRCHSRLVGGQHADDNDLCHCQAAQLAER